MIEADMKRLEAWWLRRRSLCGLALVAWREAHKRSSAYNECAGRAQERLGNVVGRRRLFRIMVVALRGLALQWRRAAEAAAEALEHKLLLRRTQVWRAVTQVARAERLHRANRQYARSLTRVTFGWWHLGSKESAMEAKLEEHRRMLQQKVSGWLREIDGKCS